MTPPHIASSGGVAQMVERSLSMREVPGSIPGASITNVFLPFSPPRENDTVFSHETNLVN